MRKFKLLLFLLIIPVVTWAQFGPLGVQKLYYLTQIGREGTSDSLIVYNPFRFAQGGKFQSTVTMTTLVQDSLNVDNGTLVVSPTTGNVGIGTMTPATIGTKTNVPGTILNVYSSSSTGKIFVRSDLGGELGFEDTNAASGVKVSRFRYSNGKLTYERLDDAFGSIDSTPLTIDTSGNVGIDGTTSPHHPLSDYSVDPAWVLTDTDVNLNVSTAAEAADSAAMKLSVNAGNPEISLRDSDGYERIKLDAENGIYITDATGADSGRISHDGSELLIDSDDIIYLRVGPALEYQAFLKTDGFYLNSVRLVPNIDNTSSCGAANKRWSNIFSNTITLGDMTTGDHDAIIYFADDGDATAQSFSWDDGNSQFQLTAPLSLFSTYTAELRNDGTDPEVTYLVLYNTDGEKCYIYPNATQDGIIVSATKP